MRKTKVKWDWINPRYMMCPDEKAAYVEIALGMFLIVSLFSLSLTNVQANGDKAKMQQTYDALVYKMNSYDVRDEFGIMNKSIVDEIQFWNENLAFNKNMEHNFWIGPYVPDIYDDFEYIKYE
jgi:hypothetical protein